MLNSYTNNDISIKDKKNIIHTNPEVILKQEDKQRLVEGIQLLKEAADNYGNKNALLTLADMYFVSFLFLVFDILQFNFSFFLS